MGNDSGAAASVALFRVIFSLLFPVAVISLCGVSYVLVYGEHLPQFGLWVTIAERAYTYAQTNIWAMCAWLALLVGALPMARAGFREHAARPSHTIGGWVSAAIVVGFTAWLANVWPNDGSALQIWVFGAVLFFAWFSVCEALLSTLKLAVQNRPQPGPEVVTAQKAHGDARVAGEAEALSLLNPKR